MQSETHIFFIFFLALKLLSAQLWETKYLDESCIREFIYSETCLNQTPVGLKNLFSLDRCLVYTGSNYIDI